MEALELSGANYANTKSHSIGNMDGNECSGNYLCLGIDRSDSLSFHGKRGPSGRDRDYYRDASVLRTAFDRRFIGRIWPNDLLACGCGFVWPRGIRETFSLATLEHGHTGKGLNSLRRPFGASRCQTLLD